jgi:hypothetical protein
VGIWSRLVRWIKPPKADKDKMKPVQAAIGLDERLRMRAIRRHGGNDERNKD